MCLKFIRCDNGGENYELEKSCIKEGLNIKFEFTARHTPQQNGVVERAFATLYGRIIENLNGASIQGDDRRKYWAECAETATKIHNGIPKRNLRISPYEMFFKEKPKYMSHLKFWRSEHHG